MAELLIPELKTLLAEVTEMRKQLNRMERLFFEKRDKPFLTITDLAEEFQLSDHTIKSWINKGRKHPQTRRIIKLPAIKTEGGHYRVKRKDLDAFNEVFTTL